MTRAKQTGDTPNGGAPDADYRAHPDRAARVARDGCLLETNPHWHALAGCAHLRELPSATDLAGVESALRSALAQGSGETRATLDGGAVSLCWRFTRVDSGTAWLTIHPAAPSPAIAAAVNQGIAAGIALSDHEGRLCYVNHAYAGIYGRPRALLTGNLFTEMLQPADRERALAHHRAFLDEALGDEMVEYEIVRSDGEPRIVNVQEERLSLEGENYRLATVLDVTESRHNERHLADTEARLRDLMDTIPGAIYQFRHSARDGYVIDHMSEGVRRIADLPPEMDLHNFEHWLEWIPAEERDGFLASIERSRERLEPWNAEWPLDFPGGRIWLQGTSRPHTRPGGDIVWNGLLFDITARKAAEERLGRARTDYEHVFEHTREGIYRSSAEGHLLDVNWPLVHMHGCSSKEELIAAVGDVAADWYVTPGARAELRAALEASDHVEDFQAEAWRIGTGERFWTSENSRVVRADDGTLLYYQGTVRDITEQRRDERFAARRAEILEMIARGEPITQIVYEIVGTIEEYRVRLTAAVCQLHEGVMDVEAAPALSNECIAAIHDTAPSEIGGAIAAAMQGNQARLESEQVQGELATESLHEAMQVSGYADVMAFPVLDQEGTVLGILIVFVADRADIDDSVRNLLHEIAQITSIAFDQHRLMEKLVEQAQFDPLTQLPNRALLNDRLQQAMLEAGRKDHPVAVILLDLDEFKLVNDTLGHNAGDQLLTEVAARLQGCLRAADTVARFGGDEFVAVVPLAEKADAKDVAERILQRLQPRFRIRDRELSALPSIGISLFPQDGLTPDNLLQAADTAMYSAKRAGKNQYRYFAESMNDQVADRLRIEAQLRDALEREELVLHFQPRVHLPGGQCYGAEALLRWAHPERGLLAPGEFLAIAEQSALIGEIDRYVLARAMRQAAEWQARGHDLLISLNLSARLLNHEGFGPEIARVIEATGARPEGLEIEITESMVMQDFAHASSQLRDLKERAPGLRIALDDFGSGYSSLKYLRELPIDTLKIDRSFIADLDTLDPGDTGRAIAKTIVELGQNLGMHVIAEGVENEGQVKVLQSIDCHEAQGFRFGYPVDATTFLDWLESGGGGPTTG